MFVPSHPRCPHCDMLIPCESLNGYHIKTALFSKELERKNHRLATEEVVAGTDTVFWTYGHSFSKVATFKYLGRILTATGDNWIEIVANTWKVKRKWTSLSRILGREGTNEPTSGNFFKSFIQKVPLFCSEMCVVTSRMDKTLGGFHHRVDRRLVIKQPQRQTHGC